MNRRKFLRSGLIGGLALVVAASRARGAAQRPNVLWIMLDDCRPDAFGCYGRPWAHTPNIDAIAAAGARFQTAVTQCPICVPSRSSMKTARYAHETGIMSMGKRPESQTPYTYQEKSPLPDLLRGWSDAGTQPTCTGKVHAYPEDWVFTDQPRSRKSDRISAGKAYPPVNLKTHGWQIGGTTTVHPDNTQTGLTGEAALGQLDTLSATGAPFFLRVSFHAPHVPIEVPSEFMVDPDSVKLPLPTQAELDSKPRFEREQLRIYAGTLDLTPEAIQVARGTYYGMVREVDHQVGRIMAKLDALGLRENTIIAINSDHGLELGDHGIHKKRNFYEQTICSPLIVSAPGQIAAGTVVDDPVEMLDFLPTLMELSGMEIPEGIRGRSLVPLMTGEGTARDATFSEIDHSGSMYDELRKESGRRVMIRTREWKLIEFRDPRVKDRDGALYDLKADPGETVNLFASGEHEAVVAQLEARLAAWEAETGYDIRALAPS